MNLSDVGVSYYEIGGAIQTSRISPTKQISRMAGVEKSISPDSGGTHSVRGVCYGATAQPHLPYSYGNPMVNLGINGLLRAVEAVVIPIYDPMAADKEVY
jgi:hypothetical protein